MIRKYQIYQPLIRCEFSYRVFLGFLESRNFEIASIELSDFFTFSCALKTLYWFAITEVRIHLLSSRLFVELLILSNSKFSLQDINLLLFLFWSLILTFFWRVGGVWKWMDAFFSCALILFSISLILLVLIFINRFWCVNECREVIVRCLYLQFDRSEHSNKKKRRKQ